MFSKPLQFFLRSLTHYLLLLGLYRYLRELVSLPLWTLVFLGGTLCGRWMGKNSPRGGFRLPMAFALFLSGLFLLRGAILLASLMGVGEPSWVLFFDNSFFPLMAPLLVTWLFQFLACRYPSFIRWEVFLNGGLLAGLFWGQGHYGITLLPHPFWLALAMAVVILLEAAILLLSSRAVGRRRMIVFFGAILLLLWGTTTLFLRRYTRGAVSRGGGLVQPTLLRFDFSRYVKLQSEISMSSDLVLLFGTEEPVDRMLLRRYILSGYSPKEGFFLDSRAPETMPSQLPDGPSRFPDPGYLGREETWQDYYLVNFDPASFVALNYPVETVPMKNWGNSSFLRNYRVLSKTALSLLEWELGETSPPKLPARDESYYTDYGADKAILSLAEEIAGEAKTNYDKVMALQRHLVENYFYSLKPGVASDGNQLGHFLFTSRKGYCSYFAFAMTLMCRSLGIPARVAVGFFVDPSLGVMNIYPIRANMAHAWVEVYFQDYGWISFDPTSTTLAPGEEYNFAGGDMEEFLSLIEEILANRGTAEEAEVFAEEGELSWESLARRGLYLAKRYWWGLVLLLWIGAASFPWLLPWLRCAWTRDYRRRGALLFSLLVKSYAVRGRGIGRTESVSEWGRRIGSSWKKGGRVSSIPGAVSLFQRSRYAQNFSRRHLLTLQGIVRRERRFLRRHTHPVRMIGILLFPWRRQ